MRVVFLPHNYPRFAGDVSAAFKAFEEASSNNRNPQDPMKPADESQVQLHVAIKNVTELMRDDPLQFIARQKLHRAFRHSNHGVFRPKAGGKGVDAGFAIQHINRRHRNTRRDRHLLDDVLQFALIRLRRRLRQLAATHRQRNGFSTLPELCNFDERTQGDKDHGDAHHPLEQFGMPKRPLFFRVSVKVRRERQQIERRGERADRAHKICDQPACSPARVILPLKKVHQL